MESEKAIIGIILLFPDRMAQAVDRDLVPEDFQAAHHAPIYDAMLALHCDGEGICFQSVYARMSALRTAQILEPYEREAYLVQLQNDCGTPAGLADHIHAVKRAANERSQALVPARRNS